MKQVKSQVALIQIIYAVSVYVCVCTLGDMGIEYWKEDSALGEIGGLSHSENSYYCSSTALAVFCLRKLFDGQASLK